MPTMTEAALKSGTIYGDGINKEYVYMPASEIGMLNPLCIFERFGERFDVSFAEAMNIVHRLSLKPVSHPKFGKSSC
ncbi:hypothetical protein [Pectinatus haikarae]|uniref:Uncharacterized protein n=1 Tax=Pectinatus haikarae TaxID=349096 RepID=A0ABT9YBS7_9FIRM|nr:hypothetical protein [Pectinatus haikarae]MDQ0204945.1 hypothetical protein [Pectinatus haikarae]